jgi:hypothetical protein
MMMARAPGIDDRLRLDAAKAALPYYHRKVDEAVPDADHLARIIECEEWSDEKAQRLEILRRERKGRS